MFWLNQARMVGGMGKLGEGFSMPLLLQYLETINGDL